MAEEEACIYDQVQPARPNILQRKVTFNEDNADWHTPQGSTSPVPTQGSEVVLPRLGESQHVLYDDQVNALQSEFLARMGEADAAQSTEDSATLPEDMPQELPAFDGQSQPVQSSNEDYAKGEDTGTTQAALEAGEAAELAVASQDMPRASEEAFGAEGEVAPTQLDV